jgi:hypothetical protein
MLLIITKLFFPKGQKVADFNGQVYAYGLDLNVATYHKVGYYLCRINQQGL